MTRWPSPVAVVVEHLEHSVGVDTASSITVAPRVPRDLKAVLPVAVVSRGPGSDDGVTDSPTIDVEVFAATDDDLWAAAEDVREAMHQLRSRRVRGALVDTVTTVTSPNEVPYGNHVLRAVATYRIALRKH